mmetsp:Transcript_9080/g.17001  ORF Transcript_9080/g.17001 Transcript_9080/m.17001 type:complete len:252 (-) Transcript_9080:881-1636(-)
MTNRCTSRCSSLANSTSNSISRHMINKIIKCSCISKTSSITSSNSNNSNTPSSNITHTSSNNGSFLSSNIHSMLSSSIHSIPNSNNSIRSCTKTGKMINHNNAMTTSNSKTPSTISRFNLTSNNTRNNMINKLIINIICKRRIASHISSIKSKTNISISMSLLLRPSLSRLRRVTTMFHWSRHSPHLQYRMQSMTCLPPRTKQPCRSPRRGLARSRRAVHRCVRSSVRSTAPATLVHRRTSRMIGQRRWTS